MSQSNQSDHHLSRREVVKSLLAATGIATLPNNWEKPVIEIGLLPAHAQASPGVVSNLFISNLNVSIYGVANNCISLETGEVGTLIDTYFEYNDLQGGITSGAGIVIVQASSFSGSDDTVEITTGFTITGTPSSGFIFYSTCASFGSGDNMTVKLSIRTPDGRTSNSLSVTVSAPLSTTEERKKQRSGFNTPNYKPL